MIINGEDIASNIVDRLERLPKTEAYIAAVQVGDDAATASFIGLKKKVAERLGLDFRTYRFPADIKNDGLRKEVGAISGHKTCGGALVELPMPEHLNWYYILNAIPPDKDVDVLGERAIGAFYAGRNRILPPAVGAVRDILAVLNNDPEFLAKQTVAVVGLGLLIGRPVANWIMRRAKETFLLRSTSDMELLKRADIVISGIGKAGVIKAEMLKEGAVVIDFGYDLGRGDFDPEGAEGRRIRYTPTPGGTGPVLIAKLFENFYELNSPAVDAGREDASGRHDVGLR